MDDKEYYPSLDEVLAVVDCEVVLVGSSTYKPLSQCKDIDFVISQEGYDRLINHEYFQYMCKETDGWLVFLPYYKDDRGCVEFFLNKCDIEDVSKWDSRVTYEEAINKNLCVKTIYNTRVLSISPQKDP